MNILIVYGTTEGQTRKIAEWTATHARERGHQVELRDSAAPISDLSLKTFHAFIIAASVHQKHHQETITNFVIAHHELLNAKPSAFISVSLSAVLEEGRTEAQKYVDRFTAMTEFHPHMTLLLGGCFTLHRIRLFPRADREIHRYEARWCSYQRGGSRVHRLGHSGRLHLWVS